MFEAESLEVERFPYGPEGTRLQARFSAVAPLRPSAGNGLLRAGGDRYVQLLSRRGWLPRNQR